MNPEFLAGLTVASLIWMLVLLIQEAFRKYQNRPSKTLKNEGDSRQDGSDITPKDKEK